MRIFVAGASGAIGRPLVAELVRRGHEVTKMTPSEAGARHLADMGAAVARVSAFDAAAVEQALRDARAEVVIDELTSCPKTRPRWPPLASMGGHPAGSFHGERPVLKLMYAALIRGAGAASSSASSRSGSSKPSARSSMHKRIRRTSGRSCARSWHLKKVSLELGGKNSLIILDDADLDLAVANTAWGRELFHPKA